MSSPIRRALAYSVAFTVSSTAFGADPSQQSLQPVQVTGERPLQTDKVRTELEHEQSLTPGGVSLIRSEDLSERNVVSLGDLMRYVPGVWTANGSTGDSTFLSSRGSNLDAVNYDGNGIKLMIDGLPVTAADGNNHNSFIDPLIARFTVIARGANALTYGASTLGGAVNFTSATARTAENQAYLSAGSHGTVQSRASLGAVSGDLDALVTVEQRSYDGYREHQEQDRGSVYANTGWQISDTATNRTYLSYVDNDQQLAGALTKQQFDDAPYQANPSNLTGNFLYNVETWRMANRTQWDLSGTSSLIVGFSLEDQSLYHPIVHSPFFSLLIDTDQTTIGSTIRYQKQQGNHDLLIGLTYGETRVRGGNYTHTAGIREDLSTRVTNKADNLEFFIVDRWQATERWALIYGVQAVNGSREVRNIAVPDGTLRNPKDDYSSLNPRIGLIFKTGDRSELFSSLSKLFEAPTLYELENEVQGSNATLDSMQGVVAEIGTRGRTSGNSGHEWHWELALYYAQIDDEILSVDDPNAPGTSLATNIDNTIHAGIEALFGASFAVAGGAHRIEPLLSITYNDFRFDDDPIYGSNQLPVAPDYFMKGELLYRHSNGFFAGLTVDLVDDRYADFMNTYEVDGYTLFGMRAGMRQNAWEVYLEGRNLTDKSHVTNLSVRDQAAEDAAILQAGEPRSAYVGVRFKL